MANIFSHNYYNYKKLMLVVFLSYTVNIIIYGYMLIASFNGCSYFDVTRMIAGNIHNLVILGTRWTILV